LAKYELVQKAGPSPQILRRVIVASPFKSGSTYCAQIVGRYLRAEPLTLRYDWLSEHVVSDDLLLQVRDRSFAINLHLRPHHHNLVACRDASIALTVLWRNLADMIVSFDDHTRKYGAHNPIFYVNHDAFVALPQQRRYRYLIDSLVPWNLGFYLSWRRMAGIALHPFERMVADPHAYFRTVLWMMGIPLDDAWLAHVLENSSDGSDARLNVGIVGRSATLLDEENRRHLERLVLDHPEAEQLDVLLWELPWEPLELERRSQYDGSVVRGSNHEPYFVSSGVRRQVNAAWLASRGYPRLRNPVLVSDAALARLTEESALT
jgi:hypothetical protein